MVGHRDGPDFADAIQARDSWRTGGPPLPTRTALGDRSLATKVESAAQLPPLAEPLQDLIDPLNHQLQRLVGHLEVRMRADVGVNLVK